MKSNTAVLDEFGQLLVQKVFDNQYRFILNKVEDLRESKGYENLFGDMNRQQKEELEFYTRELLTGALFDFLRIFEENLEFKIIYQQNGEVKDLNEISEMLKAEPLTMNGWIERFSSELNKK